MKIHIRSDTHNEFHKHHVVNTIIPYLPEEADVVILAGDIATTGSLPSILRQYGDSDVPVLYIPGNHEYYGSSLRKMRSYLKEFFKGSNIHVLNPSFYIHEDVMFIGATMWTHLCGPFHEIQSRTWSDFKAIEGINIETWNNHHLDEVEFIHGCLNNIDFKNYKKVVITHYLPSTLSVPEEFKDSASNCFFVSDQSKEMLEEDHAPKLWVHGHTHDSCDYVLGGTRVVCNPHGYAPNNINHNFNSRLIVEV